MTNRGGSDGGDSDGDDSDNSDDPNDGGGGERASRKGTEGGGSRRAGAGKVAFTREEVISNLVELFKEVKGGVYLYRNSVDIPCRVEGALPLNLLYNNSRYARR